jgi:hypothetical protein
MGKSVIATLMGILIADGTYSLAQSAPFHSGRPWQILGARSAFPIC